MQYEGDEVKDSRNSQKHKIGFEAIENFDWGSARITDRTRSVDGERRFGAIGRLEDKLHTVIYTKREDRRRIISLRRSNKAEERYYGQET